MKNFLRIFAAAGCVFAGTTFADDFKSVTIAGGTSLPIRVHGDQFMVVRNFTQETGSMRGVAMVAKPNATSGTPVSVLAAAILDRPTVEVINSVVITGPADVTFTCGTGGGNCFISYKKDSN